MVRFRVIADAALAGPARAVVLYPVAGKHFDPPVVHPHGDLDLHLALSEIHVWSAGAGSDPYVSTNTRTQLDEVGDWWHANRPTGSYPRAMVHFLSGKVASGGIAWLSVLCSGDFDSGGGHWGGAYGVTQVYGTYPLQTWDQFATAHEMGHNAGSHHTHCYSPPIDHCYNQELGCYSGPQENPGAGNGTIMSYCHICDDNGMQNMTTFFHSECAALMRNRVENCLPLFHGLASSVVIVIAILSIRSMDEMQQRIQLEALAIAFAGTGILATTYGFLQNAGLPPIEWGMWIWPAMVGLWALALTFASRRYR